MAVDKHNISELDIAFVEHVGEQPVIGKIERLDAVFRFAEAERTTVDLSGVAHKARNRAKPAGNADRGAVYIGRQPVGKHGRIELIGLAVEVEIGPRYVDPDQRSAKADDAGKDPVDMAVL